MEGNVRMDILDSERDRMMSEFYLRRGYQDIFGSPRTADKARADYLNLSRAIISSKTFANIGDRSLTEFVRRQILPPTETEGASNDIWTYATKINDIQGTLRHHAAKTKFIENAVEAGRAYLDSIRASELCEEVVPVCNKINYKQEKEKSEEEVKKKEAEILEVVEERDVVKERFNSLHRERAEFDAKPSALKTCAEKLNELKRALEEAQSVLNYANTHDALVNAIASDFGITDPDVSAGIDNLIEKITQKISEEKIRLDHLDTKIAEIRGTISALRGEYGKGEGGNRDALYKKDAQMLLEMIKREYPEANPKLLYECVEKVLDSSWQEAVENMLGNNRFGIVVAPEYHDKVVLIQKSFNYGRGDTFVLNTKRLLDPSVVKDARPGSVPTIFTYNDETARLYMEMSYGNVMLCDDDDSFIRETRALRKNGQHKGVGRTTKPGTQMRQTLLLFGRAAVEEEIRRQTERYNKCVSERNAIQNVIVNLEKKSKKLLETGRKFAASLSSYDPDAQKKFDSVNDEYCKLNDEYELLKNTDEEQARRIKLEEYDAMISRCDVEIEKYNSRITALRSLLNEEKSTLTHAKDSHYHQASLVDWLGSV